MKKYLLLLWLTFPGLLSAQIPEDGIRTSIQWLNRLQARDGIVLRAETIDNLPDSTYTYYDGKLHRRMRLTYNEEGWVALETGYTDFSNDGVVDDNAKTVYTYTHEDGFLVQEAISYLTPYHDGVWHEFSRRVNYYNANNRQVRTCLYYPGTEAWEYNRETAAVEYNEKGNPVKLTDYITVGGVKLAVGWIDVTYDAQDRITGFNTFIPGPADGPMPSEKVEVTYDEQGNRLDTYFKQKDDEWTPVYVMETLYDERGNIISEAKKSTGKDEPDWINTYSHVYLSDGETSVAVVRSGRSSIVYPNPSDDYVTVLLQEADHALVTLTNISGRTVGRQTVERRATIAVNSLPPGIYLLAVKTASGTDVHKLIVK
ncbi:MAG: T9SS type A sorting domain-containing protein [Tannerella sp.]|jgi:hypothetical protein|nr:T9SS type A sorting domain-containing protein [Tannerella sp.]